MLEHSDETRRQYGAFLERIGLGQHTTPSRTAHVLRHATLLAYHSPNTRMPAVLLVPAPIKSAYIWDLAPHCSVVKRCLSSGFQAYLIDWSRPQRADYSLGLGYYADDAIMECADAIRTETGQQRIFVAGHSLGGTLSAIFASLHPERVSGLIEIEGPIAFGSGILDLAATLGPAADAAVGAFDPVPGTLLDWLSACTDPYSYQIAPSIDLVLSSGVPEAYILHLRVRRWTLDETPMARRLFEEVFGFLYRENCFARNTLEISGRMADPKTMTMPILCIADPRSRIVPLEAIEAYRVCTHSQDVEVLTYLGDRGVVLQHVGALVGRNAHTFVWPQILRWMKKHS